MPANRICFLPGVPVIVTVHDVMEYLFFKKKYIDSFRKAKGNIKMILYITRLAVYTWAIYRLGLNRAKLIITVSQHSACDIIKHFKVPPERVKAIYHGLDDEFLEQEMVSADNKLCLELRRYVLMLGGDTYQKNPDGAISAWARVSEPLRNKYPLKIIGFCGNDQSPLIRALVNYGLIDSVEVNGWVSQNDLKKYMREAILFLYLSRYEGFGFPLLHAMASGTPVISTDKSSIPEVLGNVGLKFDPADHIGIANGIEQMLTNSSLRMEQAVSGIERAKQFCWRKSATAHLKLYVNTLDKLTR